MAVCRIFNLLLGFYVIVANKRCSPICQSGPGSCVVTGRRSDTSLYDYELATYDAADTFRHEDSAGFVRLWGLGIETWAARQGVDRNKD